MKPFYLLFFISQNQLTRSIRLQSPWASDNDGTFLRITTRTEEREYIPPGYSDFTNESEATDMIKLLLGRLLCWLGFHDFRVVDVTFEFGTSGVERDRCQRCGVTRTRSV